MTSNVLYTADLDANWLRSRTVAVLGYGSQGRAHARNLRDSGVSVVVAQRPGGDNHRLAVVDGFAPVCISDAVRQADVLVFALPDERMGDVYAAEVAADLRGGQTLGFIHGFAIRFGRIVPPKDVDVILVAPKGPGSLLRERFEQGGGLPCFFAVHQDATGAARATALSWSTCIGGGRAGLIETTFAIECETDLFGEQAVLCGGVIELMKTAFDVLVEAGYPPEAAYFECIHEVKQIVDLVYADGLAGMRRRISNTAAYGGLTRGPRLVGPAFRQEMREILDEIRSGRFAEEWTRECRSGNLAFAALAEAEAGHASEQTGEGIRRLMHPRRD